MADFYSDYTNNQGTPQLDSDYWNNQHKANDRSENYNLFDNMIKTNFDIENLKNLSVFNNKKQ